VPQTNWSINELPTEDQIDVIVRDASLSNRINVAGVDMRVALNRRE
jgi:hypothetical protein